MNSLLLLFFFLSLSTCYRFGHLQPRELGSFGNIYLPYSYSIITGALTVYFEFLQDNSITCAFLFKIPNQYLGWGWGPSMRNVDMWVFEISGSTITAADLWSVDDSTPPADVSMGGSDDLTLLGYDIQSNYTLIKVNRKLDTGDGYDQVLSEGSIAISWATERSSSMIDHHKNYGMALMKLVEGAQEAALPYSDPTNIHGILLTLSWGLLFDMALIIVRFYKGKSKSPAFQMLHSICMWITFIASTAMIAVMIKHLQELRGDNTFPSSKLASLHDVLGFVVLGVSILAMLGGIGLITMLKSNKPSIATFTSKNGHLWIGYIIYIMTRIEIVTGCILAKKKWGVVAYAYLAIALLAQIVLTFLRKKSEFQYVVLQETKGESLNEDQIKLVYAINEGTSREELIKSFPKIKWVIYQNFIVDLTGWIHPGGNFLIEASLGREVTAFLKGAYTIERKMPGLKPYVHSKMAYTFMQNAIIGTVTNSSSILASSNGKRVVSMHHLKWKLTETTAVSKNLTRFEFETDNLQVDFCVNELSALGRQFTINISCFDKLARPYTTALALTEQNKMIRDLVMNALELNQQLKIPEELKIKRGSLPLFIKKYPFPKGFSYQIHDKSKIGDEFNIEGPLGRGLEASSKSEGLHIIICAGTGVLPFVDLLHYLFMKHASEIFTARGSKESVQAINGLGFKFKNELKNFRVKLVGAFQSMEDTFGYDIIEKLAMVSSKYKRNVFDAALITAKEEGSVIRKVSGLFNEDVLKGLKIEDGVVYYVCGPPQFNIEVSNVLKRLNVSENKIMFV